MNLGYNQTTGQKNITGNKYNFLTAVSFSHKVKNSYRWLFKCECGNEKMIDKASVLRLCVKSCGCKQRELNGSVHKKHGMSETRFYKTWRSMVSRCTDKNNQNYSNYGERGITVDKKWLSFESFRNDMLENYLKHCENHSIKNTSIDRIDNNKGYTKSNCRWATMGVQANNTRNNRFMTLNGKTLTMSQWARHIGMPISTIYNRILAGKTVKEILTTQKI